MINLLLAAERSNDPEAIRQVKAVDAKAVFEEINRLENLADQISRDAIAALFVGGHDPIDIIKWKEIYETLETATDRCEDVADILERIVLKNA